MMLNKDSLIQVREFAIQELKELPRNARIKGMGRDLNEAERQAVAWLQAAIRTGVTCIEFEHQSSDSVWENG